MKNKFFSIVSSLYFYSVEINQRLKTKNDMETKMKIEIHFIDEKNKYFARFFPYGDTTYFIERGDLQRFISNYLETGYKIEFPNPTK